MMTLWLFLALPFPDAVPSDTGGSNDTHIFQHLDRPFLTIVSVQLCGVCISMCLCFVAKGSF